MAAKKKRKQKPAVAAAPPTIHEAERAPGPTGVVYKGREIDLTAAVERRRAGLDVVVCGARTRANLALARMVESSVGPASDPQVAHDRAGPHALPHFHQESRSPDGHTFFETGNRQQKARKRS